MASTLTRLHQIAYACYLSMGVIGVVAVLDDLGIVSAGPAAAILATLQLTITVPVALLLSLKLRKERPLVLLAGLASGIPMALWMAATVSPQDQSVAGWYNVPAIFAITAVSAIKLFRSCSRSYERSAR